MRAEYEEIAVVETRSDRLATSKGFNGGLGYGLNITQ